MALPEVHDRQFPYCRQLRVLGTSWAASRMLHPYWHWRLPLCYAVTSSPALLLSYTENLRSRNKLLIQLHRRRPRAQLADFAGDIIMDADELLARQLQVIEHMLS